MNRTPLEYISVGLIQRLCFSRDFFIPTARNTQTTHFMEQLGFSKFDKCLKRQLSASVKASYLKMLVYMPMTLVHWSQMFTFLFRLT